MVGVKPFDKKRTFSTIVTIYFFVTSADNMLTFLLGSRLDFLEFLKSADAVFRYVDMGHRMGFAV